MMVTNESAACGWEKRAGGDRTFLELNPLGELCLKAKSISLSPERSSSGTARPTEGGFPSYGARANIARSKRRDPLAVQLLFGEHEA